MPTRVDEKLAITTSDRWGVTELRCPGNWRWKGILWRALRRVMRRRYVRPSNQEWILAATLVGYIVCDLLLTPPAHLETRNPADVTSLGIAALALLFVGLALAVVALVLLFRRSRQSPRIAIVAALLYIPAPLTELSGHFSSLRPPAAIAWLELVQTVIALMVVAVGMWAIRGAASTVTNR